ncbi:hypothetical protein [Protofrankia coriariae]|nr:hypothetical protein [Protofrankia coriariae]ONH38141.1 hypothetical protein BL254_01635 [Protofrankia sp. BMG5.30]
MWLGLNGWVRTFTLRAVPGAYLRVIRPGHVRRGDPASVEHRPDHDVTIGMTLLALTTQPELLPLLLRADDLPAEIRERARRRMPFGIPGVPGIPPTDVTRTWP